MTERGPLLGWNVYSGSSADNVRFVEFIPAPDLDDKLSMLTDLLALEIEEG